MDDIHNLWRAIVENPDEDTPRMMYADAIEERGQPGDATRAEFIKLQLELAKNRPRWQLSGHMSYRGPNTFLFVADEDVIVSVGDRVDVFDDDGYRELRKPKRHHGLLVTKIRPNADDWRELTLKRDEYSLPFPIERVNELSAKAKALFDAHRLDWVSTFDSSGTFRRPTSIARFLSVEPSYPMFDGKLGIVIDANYYSELLLDRGFASTFRGSFNAWRVLAAGLVKQNPINRVIVADPHGRSLASYYVAEQHRLWREPTPPESTSDEERDRLIDEGLKRAWPRVSRWDWER